MPRALRVALIFLTVVPVRLEGEPQETDLGRSALFFAPIGLGIGLLVAIAITGLACLFPVSLAAVLGLALWQCLSGCLHLDGWADCCDALPGARGAARRLEILRDPRLGTFGGAGLVLLLISKAAALVALVPSDSLWSALLLGPALGRAAMVGQAWLFPLARSEGLAFRLQRGLQPESAAAAGLSALLLSTALGPRGLLALAAAGLAALCIGRVARRRLGGLTGDVYGATCEMVELVVLLVFTAQL